MPKPIQTKPTSVLLCQKTTVSYVNELKPDGGLSMWNAIYNSLIQFQIAYQV